MFLNSFSQVFLIESPFLGFLILFGMLVSQTRMGILSAIGVITGILFSKIIGIENSIIQAGMMGFNAALVGAVTGLLIQKNEIALIVAVIGSIIALLIQLLTTKYEISIFTLPFVIIAVAIFILKSTKIL